MIYEHLHNCSVDLIELKSRHFGKGDLCTVTHSCGMMSEAKPFIGFVCKFVKTTKAGLIQVALVNNPKIVHSFPKSCIGKV